MSGSWQVGGGVEGGGPDFLKQWGSDGGGAGVGPVQDNEGGTTGSNLMDGAAEE